MIRFKACPKCRGDLYETEDTFGKFLNCIQCGYLKDLEIPVAEVQSDKKADDPAAVVELHGVAA